MFLSGCCHRMVERTLLAGNACFFVCLQVLKFMLSNSASAALTTSGKEAAGVSFAPALGM